MMSAISDPVQLQWTAEKILDFLQAHAAALSQMGVVKLGLFGSYVRGQQTPESDMDFLVTMTSPSYRDFMAVWRFLEDNFRCKIDLGEEHLLKPAVRARVLQEVRYVAGL